MNFGVSFDIEAITVYKNVKHTNTGDYPIPVTLTV